MLQTHFYLKKERCSQTLMTKLQVNGTEREVQDQHPCKGDMLPAMTKQFFSLGDTSQLLGAGKHGIC